MMMQYGPLSNTQMCLSTIQIVRSGVEVCDAAEIAETAPNNAANIIDGVLLYRARTAPGRSPLNGLSVFQRGASAPSAISRAIR
jgi:hypothetical protein